MVVHAISLCSIPGLHAIGRTPALSAKDILGDAVGETDASDTVIVNATRRGGSEKYDGTIHDDGVLLRSEWCVRIKLKQPSKRDPDQ